MGKKFIVKFPDIHSREFKIQSLIRQANSTAYNLMIDYKYSKDERYIVYNKIDEVCDRYLHSNYKDENRDKLLGDINRIAQYFVDKYVEYRNKKDNVDE